MILFSLIKFRVVHNSIAYIKILHNIKEPF